MARSVKRSLDLCSSSFSSNSSYHDSWRTLRIPQKELNLALTLLTGQTFLWKQTSPGVFTGVIGSSHLVSLKQTQEDILYHLHSNFDESSRSRSRIKQELQEHIHELHGSEEKLRNWEEPICSFQQTEQPICSPTRIKQELEVPTSRIEQDLRDFFMLDTSLQSLWSLFNAADERFAAISPYIEGARLLRQNPLECVFQFICSSNNHIQRITGMVDYLASLGCHLGCVDGYDFYAFPTLEQLSLVSEKQLRDAGFGYRAKYIVGAVKALRAKEGGGEKWLLSLRNRSLEEATRELCTLPGIGPKVAACVALFSLDKHHAIPVDTHVWQIAVQYIKPELAGERLTSRMYSTVSEAFVTRFGEYAGWAHTVLFIAELSTHQNLLPSHLQTKVNKNSKRQNKKKKLTNT